ncbi:haloacid dehalogenase-like hydrolase domain-containing protein Sgpp [Malus sylvestris]|uniref:haloacid dehalogenase-like hydrolase domain-containing protein Sgpp n=1 Tax=Malus sylvestris TaxID=3752 RepID=UPI0021AD245C|nr:haloacid dehalogenase-like hydrolase domain-containing protein Sgpp [Malus sylvestris]
MLQEVGFNGGVPITEAMFRRLVSEKVEPVKGLDSLRQRIEKQGLRRAAVTNASRLNVELILSKLKLTDFFEILVLGGECVRAKPFPDPYLTAPETLKLSNKHAFIFEE